MAKKSLEHADQKLFTGFFFEEISYWLKPLYLEESYIFISDLNITFIKAICSFLRINTKISYSSEYELIGDKSERLANICKQVGATEYISGPSAKSYIDADVFNSLEIELTWFDYDDYKPYHQLWGDFFHDVSVLDLLFNCGQNATKYLKQNL